MNRRLDSIGIKQVVRMEWYDLALDMLLDGQSAKEIRNHLSVFIGERLQSGGFGERGEQTYTKAVTQIMKSWVQPDRELIEFRDNVVQYAQNGKKEFRIILHWIVTLATYPFWYRVADQVGRLLNLQNLVTLNQIRLRCFEAMGERSTVERSSRRVVRTFVAWNVLNDCGVKGCYTKSPAIKVDDVDLELLMIESILYAIPGNGKFIGDLLNSPSFFPFQLSIVSGNFISTNNSRIEIVRYGLDENLIRLKG